VVGPAHAGALELGDGEAGQCRGQRQEVVEQVGRAHGALTGALAGAVTECSSGPGRPQSPGYSSHACDSEETGAEENVCAARGGCVPMTLRTSSWSRWWSIEGPRVSSTRRAASSSEKK